MKLLWKNLNGENAHEAGLRLLESLYGSPLPEIRRTKLGKPYFTDGSAHFSISHTKNTVFCVLSDRPVGIDAEETGRNIKLSLAEKFLSPTELAQFRASEDKRAALLKFWVLKEAAGKCAGQGLQLWPNHTDFSLNDPRLQEIAGCYVAVIEGEPYAI